MTQHASRTPTPPHIQPFQTHAELQEEVSRRAYELYEARGREDGRDVDDWLQAESELAQQQAKALAA